MKPRKVVIHNYLPGRARDAAVNPAAIGREFAREGSLEELKREIMHFTPAQKSIAIEAYTKARRELGAKDSTGAFLSGAARRNGDQLEHPGTVSRAEEERNRDASYRRSGITRVKDSESKKGDPDYERWAQQKREEQNRGGGGFHSDTSTMGAYCEHCGYKAGSHQQGTMNCPKNGPGSGFNPNQKFAPVK